MNSCLYECSLMHHRFAPRVHHFQHDLFMFYLDLDELAGMARKLWLFSHNRRNVYSFCEQDHEPAGMTPLKERVHGFLRANGMEAGPAGRVMLLTLPRVLGYIFNPISIYYCFDEAGKPVATVAEVGNTFGERKLFLLRAVDVARGGAFEKVLPKEFYVSPFSPLDLSFDFRLHIPGEKLDLKIDEHDATRKVFISTLTGQRVAMTNHNLAWFSVKYPLMTVKVITLIHWHALRLWTKRLPYYRKADRPEQQREVRRPYASLNPES